MTKSTRVGIIPGGRAGYIHCDFKDGSIKRINVDDEEFKKLVKYQTSEWNRIIDEEIPTNRQRNSILMLKLFNSKRQYKLTFPGYPPTSRNRKSDIVDDEEFNTDTYIPESSKWAVMYFHVLQNRYRLCVVKSMFEDGPSVAEVATHEHLEAEVVDILEVEHVPFE